jgi:hypothetical protein
MTLEEVKKLIGIREDQICLLKAALFAPEQAITYWERWKKHKNLNHITKENANYSIFSEVDTESLRVLPLIYRNLEHSGDSLLPALRDAYRNTWMANQKLLYRAQEIVRACNDAGIPNMLLKGIPMSLHYYKDMGVRPMGDVDLLVPLEFLESTILLLESYGNIPDAVEDKYRHLIHAMHCFDEGGVDVDLHWQAFFFQEHQQSNWFFEKKYSEKLQLAPENATYILNDSYQLFHTIIHGTLEGQPTIRWILDAVKICQSPSFNGDITQITEFAAANHLDYALKICLFYLKKEFQLSGFSVNLDTNSIKEINLQKKFFRLSGEYPNNSMKRTVRMFVRQGIAYDLFYKGLTKKTKFVWLFERLKFRLQQEKKRLINPLASI